MQERPDLFQPRQQTALVDEQRLRRTRQVHVVIQIHAKRIDVADRSDRPFCQSLFIVTDQSLQPVGQEELRRKLPDAVRDQIIQRVVVEQIQGFVRIHKFKTCVDRFLRLFLYLITGKSDP